METETTTSTESGDPFSAMDPEMAANPQPVFKMLRDDMPVMSIDLTAGQGVLLTRKAEIDEALRHPEIFSSNMDAVDLKNKRPMIPLQIDPPDHKKFRKLLDPLFAPRKMALHGRRGVGAGQPPHRPVHRSGRGGLRRASSPSPSRPRSS